MPVIKKLGMILGSLAVETVAVPADLVVGVSKGVAGNERTQRVAKKVAPKVKELTSKAKDSAASTKVGGKVRELVAEGKADFVNFKENLARIEIVTESEEPADSCIAPGESCSECDPQQKAVCQEEGTEREVQALPLFTEDDEQ